MPRGLDVFRTDSSDANLRTALDAARAGPLADALERVSAAARTYAIAVRMDCRESAGTYGTQVAGRFASALYALRQTDVVAACMRGLHAGAVEVSGVEAPKRTAHAGHLVD
jgi:hypothetical protein